MKMSSAKVDYLYDVMDAAYGAGPIYEVSKSLGHVPLIDKIPRRKEVSQWHRTKQPVESNLLR